VTVHHMTAWQFIPPFYLLWTVQIKWSWFRTAQIKRSWFSI
jgi:hypothetical protein